ncbi:FliH/SctL family protein [Thermocrinis sp.]|jgi:flagellar assembly protein FliH|uniref:FliH/SctL family protein n=1 Tax=Thermocrinis sp. TaxID=2024383 RepID=UPI003C113B6A
MHEDFKPLHSVEYVLPKEAEESREEKLEKQQLLKQIEALKNTVRVLEMELLECKGKNQELARLNSKLVEEKNLLEAEKKALEEKIAELKTFQGHVEGLRQALLEKFSEVEDRVRNEIKYIAMNIAKRLYLTEKLPKEEAVLRSLQKALNSGISLKGQIKLRVNPHDLPAVEGFLKTLDLKGVQLELIKDEHLSRGEFSVETADFWIERRLEDLLKDIEEGL